MLRPTIVARTSFFAHPELKSDTLICQSTLQDNLENGWKERLSLIIRPYFHLQLENYLFTLFETMLYLLLKLKCFIIQSSDFFIPALDFILFAAVDIS